MDTQYDPKRTEASVYRMWEKGGYFTPKIDRTKKPFTILLPLPNANDPMHMGHALFVIQDILIRYHRMKGDPTLWLPGGDHAGIETQYVFEKKLAKEGKSRFDFDRDTLYRLITEFVEQNKTTNRDQMKRLGFSLDWTRYRYSLEPQIISRVLETFISLYKDQLIYRAERMVNYCTKCGTAFSDLEINHEEKHDTLYYLDYGSIVIATARPETIFADVAVAVHPEDPTYKNLIGKTATIPLVNREIPVIADTDVDMEFGTGALKVTPAHDPADYAIGIKHALPVRKTIDLSGRLKNVPEKYTGMKVAAARCAVVEDLKAGQKLKDTQPLTHTVSICYRCKTTIEPMLMPQWFVKTKPLAKPAIKAVKTGKTTIVPLKRFETLYFDWMENIEDWNISRQIVWGPRMPVWYSIEDNPDIRIDFRYQDVTVSGRIGELLHPELKTPEDFRTVKGNGEKAQKEGFDTKKFTLNEVRSGLQTVTAPIGATYIVSVDSPGPEYIQETDTFDTWFLSAQWPANTLKSNPGDFEYFYPTSVLDTLWDILFFWVARMMMLGIYRTGYVPFTVIHLHSRVVDTKGQKMSKSRGNVVNPIDMVDTYNADALRMALVYGTAPGGDIVVSEDKIRGMRNFTNKLWNIGRLLLMNIQDAQAHGKDIPFWDTSLLPKAQKVDRKMLADLSALIKTVTDSIDTYRFSDASQALYDFTWHTLADVYAEENKQRFREGDPIALSVFRHVYLTLLKLLHPFVPFVTEAVWEKMPRKKNDPLIISSWPTLNTEKHRR